MKIEIFKIRTKMINQYFFKGSIIITIKRKIIILLVI